MQRDVLAELFQKYYNDALLYVVTMSKSKEVAEDIVSTAFYKALDTVDDSVTNFKWWLLKVCRNLFLDWIRKESRRGKMPTIEQVDESQQIIERIIREENYSALHKAVALLDDDYRECVLLFYFEQMPVAAIADVLGKTQVNVKTILYRARQQLKTILEEK